jgi:CHASE3 domain sensor protein
MRNINWTRVVLFIIILGVIACITTCIVFSQIKETIAKNNDVLIQVIERVKGLHPAIEDIEFQSGNKSYTINKSKVYLCIYDENKNPYPLNMLVYVMIHEIAHVITESIGHTQEFHDNFEMLLEQAANEGRYDPSIPLIQNYCGHK